MMRWAMVGLVIAGLSTAALAADPALKPLPSLALDPQTPESIWHGFYIGTDVVAVSRKGTKGFVGGDVTAGYTHVLPNNVVLGIDVATGVAPGFSAFGPVRGYDFASLGTRVGYETGRWTPYVTGDLVLAKPNTRLGSAFSGMDTANDLFNSTEKLGVGGRVGAGVDYALTSNVTVGVGLSVSKGAGSVFP